MKAPTMIARNHAFVLVLGGEYRGSVLDASVISNSDDFTASRPRDRLITITATDVRNAPWRRSWTWCKKDIKWITEEKLSCDRQFEDGVTYNVNARVRKAIKKFGGAWVIRFRVGR